MKNSTKDSAEIYVNCQKDQTPAKEVALFSEKRHQPAYEGTVSKNSMQEYLAHFNGTSEALNSCIKTQSDLNNNDSVPLMISEEKGVFEMGHPKRLETPAHSGAKHMPSFAESSDHASYEILVEEAPKKVHFLSSNAVDFYNEPRQYSRTRPKIHSVHSEEGDYCCIFRLRIARYLYNDFFRFCDISDFIYLFSSIVFLFLLTGCLYLLTTTVRNASLI
ncbi:uncharacterized protein NEMAJ01_0548 [Nematocida major]|uniref:uncharacterized protein n=1 Tax=Nematocida major TaxID=1912982 RepID=UPI0020073573|nr:uncharacterized protein NEMAJ01_0548 [Nematocida major]KAH9385652.1 hypothetical protein NEMAJ01_0548 [Nematocida major]